MVYRVELATWLAHDFAKFTHPPRPNRIAPLPGQNFFFREVMSQFGKKRLNRLTLHELAFDRVFDHIGNFNQCNRLRLQFLHHLQSGVIHVIFFRVAGIGFLLIVGMLVLDVLIILFLGFKTLRQCQQFFSGRIIKFFHFPHSLPSVVFRCRRRAKVTAISSFFVSILKSIQLENYPNFLTRLTKLMKWRGIFIRVCSKIARLHFAITKKNAHRRHRHKLEMLAAFDKTNTGKRRNIQFF